MNQLFRGIDLDLRRPGNPAACGIFHLGAQGSTVTDVTVRASQSSFACACGLNGAGGMHSNLVCDGGRYGLYIEDAQPVPSGVGITLLRQSVSAVTFISQETLSLVGVTIVLPEFATGAAVTQICTASPQTALARDRGKSMSLIDVSITCEGSSQRAIATNRTLYARDLWVHGCGVAIDQGGAPVVHGPPPSQWLHVSEYAKGGADLSPWYRTDVVYKAGKRVAGGVVSRSSVGSTGPPADLLSKHLWDESFPDMGTPGVADAKAVCGAKADGHTDDTASLQACLSTHRSVFLPPGLYRISDTLELPPGGSLVGMNNAASILLASSSGFPKASATSPRPMLRTAEDIGPGARPTVIAFVGVVTWQHLDLVSTLDWRTQHPSSLWRTNFESRDCECLWLSAYQQLAPTIVPCKLPVNITIPKSVFRGLGRIHGFVNDDTGAIISTGAKFRSLLVANTSRFSSPSRRLRLYSVNLEHAQTEANGEIANSSFVDVYSIKGEGNTPLLWVRGDTRNVSVLGFGGDPTAFPFNFTQPSDFAQLSASMFRVSKGARGVSMACLTDHGSGAKPPYWPPSNGHCKPVCCWY